MSPREHRASLRRDLQEGSYCAQFKTYHDEMKENENEELLVTEAELARVLDLDAKATEGPWEDDGTRALWHPFDESEREQSQWEGEHITLGKFDPDDLSLIAAYRTLTPRLARELAAARAAIKAARDALETELKINEKQVELLSLRMKESPKDAEAIRPFGSAFWRTTVRLKEALAQLNTHTHE